MPTFFSVKLRVRQCKSFVRRVRVRNEYDRDQVRRACHNRRYIGATESVKKYMLSPSIYKLNLFYRILKISPY